MITILKKTIMKKLWTLLLVLSLGTCMYAQNKKDSHRSERRKDMSEKMAQRMAQELELNDEMTAWFVPLYQEYQDSLRVVRRLGSLEIDNQAGLTDQQAEQLVEIFFVADETRTSISRLYHAKFKERLSPKQLLKIFMPRHRFNSEQQPRKRRGQWNSSQNNPPTFQGGFPQRGDFPNEMRDEE